MPALKKPGQWLQGLQDSLERGVHSDHEEVVLRQARGWAQAITWTLVSCTAFGIGWLALASTEEIVVAPGKLEPIGSVKEVQMPLQGVAKQILVKEGDSVKKGQVLIRLDTEASAERQESTLRSLALKRRELQLKEQELERTRELSNTTLKTLQQNLDLATLVMQRLEGLYKQGASAELQYLEQKTKVQSIQGDMEKTVADQSRQDTILRQNIQELNGQLQELGSKLTESNVTLRYQAIRAPVDGVVFDLKPTGPGFVAQSSEPVLKIVPYDKLKARVEIESDKIGFVSVGKRADISIDSFPSTDFGVLEGSVTKIGSDALPPDQAQNKGTYRFPADITLSSQQLKLKDGVKLPLQVGMSLTANIKLRKVTYLQLLLSSFKDKTDSLRRI